MSVYSVGVILLMSVITQDGNSALILAAVWGKTEVVVELVKAGANVDLQNEVCCIMNTCMYLNVPYCRY